jgi:hypothetical protein
MRDPQLLSKTVSLIEMYRFELGNLLNNNNNEFETGFLNYLKLNQAVGIKDSEFETSMGYLRQHLQGEIGMWTEDEVNKTLLEWRISTQTKPQYTILADVEPGDSGKVMGIGTFDEGSQTTLVAMPNDGFEFDKWSDEDQNYGRTIDVVANASYTAIFRKKEIAKPVVPAKKETARAKVKQISDIDTTKAILERIIDKADDSIINIIIEF